MDKQYLLSLITDIDAYIDKISKKLPEDDTDIFWITETLKEIKKEIER